MRRTRDGPWEVRVRASGRLIPTLELVRSLSFALRCPEGMDRAIVCADLRRGTVEIDARVRAPTRRAARRVAAQALAEALGSVGVEVAAPPMGWRRALGPRNAVLALVRRSLGATSAGRRPA